MKKTTFFLLLTLFVFNCIVQAQTVYVGTDTGLKGDDYNSTAEFPIGFSFTYYGVTYTTFNVTTNSGLFFLDTDDNRAVYQYSNDAIPTSSFTAPILLPFWDDLMSYGLCGDGNTYGKDQPIMYYTSGSAPNRQLIVQWTNYGYYSSDLPMGTFQIILEETTNKIYFQYLELNSTRSFGESATIGIQSANGTYYEQIAYDNSTAISIGQCISFTPSGATDYTVNTSESFIDVRLARTTTPPSQAILISPADTSTGVSTTPTFDWSDALNADEYDLLVATDNQFNNTVIYVTNLTSSQATYGVDYNTGLTGKTKYYWVVIARKSCDQIYSEINEFTTKPTVSVAGTGTGQGTITGTVKVLNDINASYNGSTTGDTIEPFDAGSDSIQLTASPAVNTNFTGWNLSGITPTTSTDNPLTLNPAGDSGNITATATFALKTYTISGNISDGGSPVQGVTVTFSYDGSTTSTDASGNYSKVVIYGTTTNVTPSKTGYTFTPSAPTLTSITSNQTQNFEADVIQNAVSGTILDADTNPLAGVTVTFSHDGSTVSTAADGTYSKNVDYGTDTTVTPTVAGYTFAPASQAYTNITAPQVQDFTGTINTYTISGTVVNKSGTPIEDVTITFSHDGSTLQTAADGTYSKTVNYGTTTTVTPSLTLFKFTPTSVEISSISANETADFVGELLGGTVQVFITPPGAVNDGALWNVDGGDWRESGAMAKGVVEGTHKVYFKDVPGWFKPAPMEVYVQVNGHHTLTGNYTIDEWYQNMPRIHYFSANPEIIGEQDETLLKWSVEGADDISIDQGVGGGLAAEGSVKVTPGGNIVYTLTASNQYGTATATVEVKTLKKPQILWFETTNGANNPINKAGTAILDWGVYAADKVTIKDKPLAPAEIVRVDSETGIMEVSPNETTKYILTASNLAGEVEKEVIVYVDLDPKITSFTAMPGKIVDGEKATLSWTTDGATSATISGIGDVDPVAGSKKVSPEKDTSYQLVVINEDGRASKTVSVEVESNAKSCDLSIELFEDASASASDYVGVIKTYQLKVENKGVANSGKFDITLSSTKGVGDEVRIKRLKAGNSVIVSLDYLPLVKGPHKLYFNVDPGGLNADENRNNNMVKLRNKFVQLAGPDLLCKSLDLRPDPDEGEGYAVVEVELHNCGSKASDGFQWQIWISNKSGDLGELFSQGSVDSLNSGKTYSIAKILELERYGKRLYITVISDAYHAINETNEMNNSKTKKFLKKNIR